MSTVAMPCLDGATHKWSAASGVWSQWRSYDVCSVCELRRGERTWTCPAYCDGIVPEFSVVIAGVPDSLREWQLRPLEYKPLRSNRGCDDCREQFKRWVAKRQREEDRKQEWFSAWDAQHKRQAERDAIRREKEEQWQLESQKRMEIGRQRQLLREGHRTLKDIRRHLREAARSQPPELRLAKTSPTS